MPGLETNVVLLIAGILGMMNILMRLVRAYGDEMLDFARWLKSFIVEIRRLRD